MIYFAQTEDNRFIKIGLADDPIKRLAGLQTSIPYALKLLAAHPGDRNDERELHQKFAADRVRGEWFKVTYDLVSCALWDGLDYTCRNYKPKNPQAELFAYLIQLEPALRDLYVEAASTYDDGKDDSFCANAVWYGYDSWNGLKPHIQRLVGWNSSSDFPELHTREAYSAAYRTIYEALPHCRNCTCA